MSLSVETIRRRIAAGDLRAYRCGKSGRIISFKTDDLEAMMRPVPSVKDSWDRTIYPRVGHNDYQAFPDDGWRDRSAEV